MTDNTKHQEMLLACRGIDIGEECPTCQGLGVKMYANTSTWGYGIGGSACTVDACDTCWGSGKKDRPWPSHRKFYDMKRRLEKDV